MALLTCYKAQGAEFTRVDEDTLIQAQKVLKMSDKYVVSFHQLYQTLRGESNLDHSVCEKGGYCDGGKAYGWGQFHEPTFSWMKDTAISEGYPFESFEYKNKDDQLELMAWAFSHGLAKHWTCWRAHFGDLTPDKCPL